MILDLNEISKIQLRVNCIMMVICWEPDSFLKTEQKRKQKSRRIGKNAKSRQITLMKKFSRDKMG